MKIKFKSFLWISILILILVYAIIYIYITQETYATSAETQKKVNYSVKENEFINEISIKDIINENRQSIKQEIETREDEVEYNTIYRETANIAKGNIQVLRQGQNGIKQVIVAKNNEEEKIIATKIIKNQVDKIVEIGTSTEYTNGEIKEGKTAKVYAKVLDILEEPNINSNKLIKASNGEIVKILEIQDNWAMIEYKNYSGWVEVNCLTNQEKIVKEPENTNKISNLNFNMNLNIKSGLTQSQFEKILSNNSQDKNSIMQDLAKYFYYAEKQYNVNGVFLAAVAIHESNWGTSKIAVNKHNLFGYRAYDNSAYQSAQGFTSYQEGIDLLARVFVKYYINPAGTSIYEGQVADGRYYNGNTIKDVNKRYATDSNWANSVYKWMEYLYKKI